MAVISGDRLYSESVSDTLGDDGAAAANDVDTRAEKKTIWIPRFIFFFNTARRGPATAAHGYSINVQGCEPVGSAAGFERFSMGTWREWSKKKKEKKKVGNTMGISTFAGLQAYMKVQWFVHGRKKSHL